MPNFSVVKPLCIALGFVLALTTLYVYAQNKVVVIPLGESAQKEMPPTCISSPVVAHATIDVRSVSANFSTAGVFGAFTCNGEDLLVRKSGCCRLQIVLDDGGSDADIIGVNFVKFGVVVPGNDAIFANSSSLLACASPAPTILCTNFDFRDADSSAFPDDIIHYVAYGGIQPN